MEKQQARGGDRIGGAISACPRKALGPRPDIATQNTKNAVTNESACRGAVSSQKNNESTQYEANTLEQNFALFSEGDLVPGAGAAIGVMAMLAVRNNTNAEVVHERIKNFMKDDALAFWEYCANPSNEQLKDKCSSIPNEFWSEFQVLAQNPNPDHLAKVERSVRTLVDFNNNSSVMRKPIKKKKPEERNYYITFPNTETDKNVLYTLAKHLLKKQCFLLMRRPVDHNELIKNIENVEGEKIATFSTKLDTAPVTELKRMGGVLQQYGPPLAKGECDIAMIALEGAD